MHGREHFCSDPKCGVRFVEGKNGTWYRNDPKRAGRACAIPNSFGPFLFNQYVREGLLQQFPPGLVKKDPCNA